MTVYYDKSNERLVYVGEKADSHYWDRHWSSDKLESRIRSTPNRLVLNNTRKYLPKGATVLEGGCGIGDKVYLLQSHGYNAYGVDFTGETVSNVNTIAPDLNITRGDVRGLGFPDGFFDGYWSLGVIEHFYQGYASIMTEMHRMLKKNGYLFLTVPTLSPLRKLKARLNLYPYSEGGTAEENDFYQFALSPKSILHTFREAGFVLEHYELFDGVKGLKDEVKVLRPLLQWSYDSRSFFAKVIRVGVNLIVRPFTGHMIFCVFRKS